MLNVSLTHLRRAVPDGCVNWLCELIALHCSDIVCRLSGGNKLVLCLCPVKQLCYALVSDT